MLGLRDHLGVGVPEVREAQQAPVRRRHAPPQPLAGLGPPVAHGEGDDLARPPAQGEPDPALVPAAVDERPQLVQLQHVIGAGGPQRPGQRRQGPGFFLASRPVSGG